MPEIIVKLADNVVQKYFIYKDEVTIGRSPENEITIDNLAVSRKHAVVKKVDGGYFIEDNGSANGIYVNDVRVSKSEVLDRDIITVGKHQLHFYNQQTEALPDFGAKTMLVDHAPSTGSGSEEPPSLRVTHGKQKETVFELQKVETRIGRAADNDIRIHDWFVSKHHALILRKGSDFFIRDLASWRHTTVNGVIVHEKRLEPGDEIQFGPKTIMLFEDEAGAARGPAGEAPERDRPVIIDRFAGMPESRPITIEAQEEVQAADGETPSGADPRLDLELEQSNQEPEERNQSVENERVSEPAVVEYEAFAHHDETPGVEFASPGDLEFKFEQGQPAEAGGESLASADDSMEQSPESEDLEAADDGASALQWESSGSGVEPVGVEGSDSAASGSAVKAKLAATPGEKAADEVADTLGAVAEQLTERESPEVKLWLQALKNPSAVIRKQAQRKLKQLTGQDYEID